MFGAVYVLSADMKGFFLPPGGDQDIFRVTLI